MAAAILSGVLGSAKTGKPSAFSLFEFWSANGAGRAVRGVSEASKGVSGLSVSVLSESLAQLAASRAVKISRQKARKVVGDGLFMGIYFSNAAGRQWVRV